MFLRLTEWRRPNTSTPGNSVAHEYTWVNFNNVTEFYRRTFKINGQPDQEYTIIFFNTGTHEDQSSTNVIETPEVICELLKENTTVKVLFGGN